MFLTLREKCEEPARDSIIKSIGMDEDSDTNSCVVADRAGPMVTLSCAISCCHNSAVRIIGVINVSVASELMEFCTNGVAKTFGKSLRKHVRGFSVGC